MKIIRIVTIAILALGLSQLAYADETNGKQGEHMKHGMQDADTNKDGVISRDEFMAAHQAMAEKMFDKLDTNHDGKIDQAERDAMKAKMHEYHEKHEMENETKPK
jgi:Ca2+-binding EF-hand superfamily protein